MFNSSVLHLLKEVRLGSKAVILDNVHPCKSTLNPTSSAKELCPLAVVKENQAGFMGLFFPVALVFG